MLRFRYNGKFGQVTAGGFFELKATQTQTEEEFLSSVGKSRVERYRDFVARLYSEESKCLDTTYYFFAQDGYIFVASKELDKAPRCKVLYKAENAEVYLAARSVFGLSDDGVGRSFSGNKDNGYCPVTCPGVISVILAYNDILSNHEQPFTKFYKKKKSGKKREIIAPHPALIKAFQSVNKILQEAYDGRNAGLQVAYKKGYSVVDNARKHIGNKFLFKLDLHDFFPSCKRELVEPKVRFLFEDSDLGRQAEKEFLDILLYNDALFIGNPISGCLANAIISNPVRYMRNIFEKDGVSITVYADDVTVSSDKFLPKGYVEGVFATAFAKYKLDGFFSLNTDKSYGESGARRHVTNVAINDSNKMTTTRSFYREVRVEIHKLSLGNEDVNLNKLKGQLSYAAMLDESGKYIKLLDKFADTVKKYGLCSEATIAKLRSKTAAK